MDEHWIELGRQGAKEMGIDPIRIEYIKAKGFLCHELLYLLGGRIEFILRSSWQLISIFADILFKTFPICRWYPPEGSILELVGTYHHYKTKVYRLTITQDDRAVFFIEYKPEAPDGSGKVDFPYNVPCLVKFLCPPFNKNKESILKNLRCCIRGRECRYEPVGWLPDEMNKELWEGFIQITAKDQKISEDQ